jgi:integrase
MPLTTSLSPHYRRSTRHNGGRLKIIQQQLGHEHASTTSIYTKRVLRLPHPNLRRALDATAGVALRTRRT